MFLLILSLLIGPLLTIILTALNQDAIIAASGGLGATITSITTWIKKQTEWYSSSLEKVERQNAIIQSAIDKRKEEVDLEIQKQANTVELVRRDLDSIERRRDEIASRLVELQDQLRRTTSPQLLSDFIQSRIDGGDYKKHLGLVALIRNDFEKLSKLIEESNEKILSGENTDSDFYLNRIVLYIDDLDCCPPQKVVEVLQAVHLFLAFPLFVVVVGVDSRWV